MLIFNADNALEARWSAKIGQNSLRPYRARYFSLKFNSLHPMVRIKSICANQGTLWFGSPWGNLRLLVSCDLLTLVRGHLEFSLMEDVAFAERLKGRLNPLPLTLATSATRSERSGWLLEVAII